LMETDVAYETPVDSDCSHQKELPDQIKWDVQFDADKLRKEVSELIPHLAQKSYVYYHVVPLRGGELRADRLSGVTDYSDPSLYEWMDNREMQFCPYIKQIADSFETEVTNVRLMRLEAGSDVKEHMDPTLDAIHRSVIRLTIPIFSDENVTFLLNGKPVPMEPGELWYMRLSDPHAVLNRGETERINLSIDLVYNDWLDKKLWSLVSG